MRSLDEVIDGVLGGRPVVNIDRMVDDMTALLVFLDREPLSKQTIRGVHKFVDNGASLTLANSRGVSAFDVLISSLGMTDHDEDIIRLLMRSSGELTASTTKPLSLLMQRFYADRALDGSTTRHPVRRLVHHLLTEGVIRESSSDLAIQCIRALPVDAMAFIVDIIRSARLDPDDLDRILFNAAWSDREDVVGHLLDKGAPVSFKTANYYASMARKPRILRLLLPYIMGRKNDLLDNLLRSSFNKRSDNPGVRGCLMLLLGTGAVASPSVMRMLISRNKLHLVRLLHQHGSRLVLPTEIPAKPRAYNWARGEMERASTIGRMATQDMMRTTSKPRKNQKLWKRVARDTATLPRQLILQLRELF